MKNDIKSPGRVWAVVIHVEIGQGCEWRQLVAWVCMGEGRVEGIKQIFELEKKSLTSSLNISPEAFCKTGYSGGQSAAFPPLPPPPPHIANFAMESEPSEPPLFSAVHSSIACTAEKRGYSLVSQYRGFGVY